MLDTKNPLAPITVGSGFIVTVNPAIVLNNGTPTSIPSTIISLTPSATNFIHITSAGSLTVNTTGFPAGCLPIATVTCSSTSVTSVADSRPDFYLVTSAASPATLFAPWGGIVAAASTTTALSAANKIQVSGFYVPYSVSSSSIVVSVGTSDGANNYDWGVYDSSGNLKAHVGAHLVAGTGIVDLPVSSFSLAAGKYYFAFTGAANTAVLRAATGTAATLFMSFANNQEVATASSGGVLPSTIAVPSDSWVASSALHAFTLHS